MIVRAAVAQSDINKDLHTAELKYTVLNVFECIVLTVAACYISKYKYISKHLKMVKKLFFSCNLFQKVKLSYILDSLHVN